MTAIMITGVGGQGTLLASRIIGGAAVASGLDVKLSEVHGMAQRGGNVVTYVKYGGGKVYSPVVGKGEADVILAFELLEGYRALPFLKKGGRMILNEQRITPVSILTKTESYPADILAEMKKKCVDFTSVDAHGIASSLGNARAANVVLIGMLSAVSGIDKSIWLDALKASVPKAHIDINIKAFEAGFAFM